MAEDPSAVLLVRVWLEGDERAFRARLSWIGSPGSAEPEESTVAVAASPGDVLVAVEQWLAGFARSGRDEPGP
jgi:hypothetical protein